MSDIESKDFFSDDQLVNDPYPYLAAMRSKCPVYRVPHHDVTELIDAHRDAIPMSDQIITLDPPTHTDHRALLMGRITPKRLKENEAFMWELADRVLDSFLTGGCGEFIGEFAAPFSLLVIADLLGVPEEDRGEFAAVLGRPS